jgi:hypothetical protein
MGALSGEDSPHRRSALRAARRFPPKGEGLDVAGPSCLIEDTR